VRGEKRPEKLGFELGGEDREADALLGGDVGVRVRDPFDQPVEAEATQVVGHLAPGVLRAEESGRQPGMALVGEADDGVDEKADCTGQGHGALVPEAHCSASLALSVVGLADALDERRGDGTALAGTFDPKEPRVNLRSARRTRAGARVVPGATARSTT